MTFSIDTNVFADLLRRRNFADRRALSRGILAAEPIVASILVCHELLLGAELHPSPESERKNVRILIAQIRVEAFDGRDMAVAAGVRADLMRQGLNIGPYDVLIASQALARGWIMVTNNVREFSRVRDLKIAEWTAMRELWSNL